MAFDLYLNKERAYIDHHEEELFLLINDDEAYPQLNWLWEMYYDGPVIQPIIANDLVHELITLREVVKDDKYYKFLIKPIDRMIPLLSKAYKSNQQIKCMSD
jgi:hypothetical protein